MSTHKNDQKKPVSNNEVLMGATPEEVARNIELIRVRESRRPRRTNIDWFSI